MCMHIEELSENVLVKDLIYVFQDIEGKYIRFSPKDDAFRIQPQVSGRGPKYKKLL